MTVRRSNNAGSRGAAAGRFTLEVDGGKTGYFKKPAKTGAAKGGSASPSPKTGISSSSSFSVEIEGVLVGGVHKAAPKK